MYTYLTMTSGSRAGTSYLLDPTDDNRIGRGLECAIVLTDPLCSRVHVVITHGDNAWKIRDADSRNGTFVNGQKIDDAVLAPGHRIRLGSTEFCFQQSETPPQFHHAGITVTQTLIKNQSIDQGDAVAFRGVAAIPDSQQAQELLLLYQLSIKLLGCDEPDEVVRVALELLADWTHATLAGFLWISDDGQLKPKILIPAAASDAVALSKSLTDLVCQQKNAVWIANESSDNPLESLQHYADAVCVPLIHDGVPMGAIHVYLDQGRFRQADFDFAISLANIAAVALARARRESRLHTDYLRLVDQSPGHSEMIGESRPMRELKTKINRLARATGCVLIRGESGVGKELVARALHRASQRADRPMLSVNCAAIPADLMESQLFGHKAGSFTGADRDHTGYFQQADLGTLFLDEVGEMTLEGQAKLLRILEGHPFLSVGATEEVTVDVRVIAATNQDLQHYVREKKFREDLYYRLSVFELLVPPLRERGEDIGLLIDFFLDHFRRQHGRPTLGISSEAHAKLLGYQWPGNVRQLRNVIDSAVVLADGDQIEVGDLGLRGVASGELESLDLAMWERRLIAEALRRTEGNVPDAARLLGIGRATLYRKVEQYGIARETGRPSFPER
ncbi:MAG TPA: sigma 54-interacting transcriptional regulator [Pirellulales bacterium]|nr:sigma 54-interacting transcriptional regulator [Pirellulales bacterium]